MKKPANGGEWVEFILSQIFSEKWTGKKLRITVDTRGPSPKRGRRYIRIYKYPQLVFTKKEELDRVIEEWRKRVEPYLIHTNHIWYRTSTKGGASKLYLLYDADLD